jgi:hypothetical protein
LIGFHHRVIQADGEEDQLVLLVLFLQRRFNFVFSVSEGQRAEPDPCVFKDRDTISAQMSAGLTTCPADNRLLWRTRE